MRYNILIYSLLFACFIIYSNKNIAQKTAINTDTDNNFKKATELFEKQKYGLSQKFFDDYLLSNSSNLMTTDADYYSALCSYELFNKNTEYKFKKIITENQESSRLKYTFLNMGKLQYREKKFKNAINWFEKVDPYFLLPDEKAEYYFKSGYSYFVVKDFEKAEKMFYEIKDINNKYTTPAVYFYSHIAYTKKNYETALSGFRRLSTDESFGTIVPYYISQIFYLQEQFDSVIAYAPPLLDSATTKRAPEIARIIGESYYRTNKFSDAVPYLETYRDKTPSLTRRDIYELGYAYYKAEMRVKAIATLEKMTNENDSLTQNALFILADCYLAQNDFNSARVAFGNASKYSFDKNIQEDAMYNYAKLTFEQSFSPFNEAIVTLNQFITTFPNSPKLDDVYTLLGKVYMYTKNYKEAVEALENIKEVTNENEEAYQRVTFFRALELFNNLNFEQAIINFDKSLNNDKYNQLYKAQSIFWKAESYYRLDRFNEAKNLYNKFLLSTGAFGTKEFNMAYYGLGYCYFKDADYKQALVWFRKFTDNQKNVKSKMIADAYCRIGDCNFSARNYDIAAENYSKTIELKMATIDYAMYQKGFCLGLLKQENEEIIVLNQLISDYPNSVYIDAAIFELGNSYVAINEKDMALNTYQKIIDDYPSSNYVRKAYIKRGLVYYNNDQNTQALAEYKKVIENYQNTPEAKDAYTGLKNVYMDMNDVNSYYTYLKERGNQGDFRISEQDSLMYTTAEKVYMEGNCEKAISLLSDYITKFNLQGIFSVNAYYYKAECLSKPQINDEAISLYKQVLSKPNNTFTEPSLIKVSKYEFDKGNFSDALNYYTTLENVAAYQNNIITAKIGKMRCYFNLNDFENAKKAAVQLLGTNKISDEIFREAHFIIGKCEYNANNLESALEEFKLISKSCKSPIEAEAKYSTAEIYYKQNQYDLAQNEIFDFIKKNTPQQKWFAKAFLLLADTYIAKTNYFQAKATLQSVIDNYKVADDGMIDDAKSKLDQIKTIEEQEKLKQLNENNLPENGSIENQENNNNN